MIVFNPTKRKIKIETKKILDQYIKEIDNLVICIGGDGSLLGAELKYPGVPKLAIKVSKNGNMCVEEDLLEIKLKDIVENKIKPKEFLKLNINVKNKNFISLNELNLKNKDPRAALRFKYKINEWKSDEILSDGVVISTPFGSTGYFKSIAHAIFENGIGMAINNPTVPQINKIINEEAKILIEVVLGPALVFFDNSSKIIEINTGDKVLVTKSEERALIY